MATKPNSSTRSKQDQSTIAPLAALANIGNGFDRQMLDSCVKAQANAARRMVALNEELLRFTVHRLKLDDSLFARMTKNGGPASLAEAWSEFMATAAIEYTEEMRKLWGLYLDQTTSTFEETQKELFGVMATAAELGKPHESAHTSL
jgi:hypothetical protein